MRAVNFLLFFLILLHISCNNIGIDKKGNNDTIYIYGYFYPKERLYVEINGQKVFDSTMAQIEYFELPVGFRSRDSDVVKCNLSYNGQVGITREYQLTDTSKRYMIIIPIGVPKGYHQLDTTKPPPFGQWRNMRPDSLYREVRLDFKGRLN